jgi:enoyl-CoA hydratase
MARRRIPAPVPALESAVGSAVDAHGVATLTLNRPEALNALDGDVLDALRAAVEDLNGKARAILVTGAGKAFVAGADIAQMAALGSEEAAAFSRRGQAAFQAFADFPGPVVAAVNGYALGGGLELAMACDIIVASDKAVLGQPEVGLGVVPGFGGSQRLPRRVGPARAKWLLMTGERLKAEQALAIGLVDKVVPAEQLMAEAHKLIDACLANGPLAMSCVKRLVNDGLHLPLRQALELEADMFGDCFGTQDQKEGMQAFLEKRKPQFKGA